MSRDPYTGEPITFTNWFPGWPDGNWIDRGTYWHVWVYKEGETAFISEFPTTSLCFFCSGLTPQLQVVKLRGLCTESQFDRWPPFACSHDHFLTQELHPRLF